jgi:UPF0755 protein
MNVRATLIIGAVILIAVVAFVLCPRSFHAASTHVAIPSGSGAAEVGHILQRAGVVRWGPAFRWYATLTGNARTLKAGEYLLCSCSSVPELVRTIASGEALSTDIEVTIPEGMNIWEVDDTLAGAKLVLPGLFARYFFEKEGMLYPETYRFASGSSLADIEARMQTTYVKHATNVTRDQLIVASMLEKEAKTKDDMAIVSGIIQKRLQLQMPLQIDATVAYGWCLRRWLPMSSSRNCDVTQAPIATEIKVDGAYNTYARKGLPAGPISNPGENALWAAAHPKTTDYLYYLSTRDGSKIIYAKTLAEHLKNRSKYLGL